MERIKSHRVVMSIESLETRRLLTGAGDPVTSFNNGRGLFAETPSGTPNIVVKVVVQPDGKILDLGYTDAGQGMVRRLNRDGTPDTSFNGNGVKLFQFPMQSWAPTTPNRASRTTRSCRPTVQSPLSARPMIWASPGSPSAASAPSA